MPEPVFKASGHLEHFTDYVVECTKCGRKYRADHLIEEELEKRLEEMAGRLVAEVDLFMDGMERRDDLTLLIARVKE